MKNNNEPADYSHLLIIRPKTFLITCRDVILILTGWLIVCLMLTDVWLTLFDYLKDPIFSFLPAEQPDWGAIWSRLSSFVYCSLFLIVWIVGASVKRYQMIKRDHQEYTDIEEKDAERIAEQAILLGGMAAMKWHVMSNANVHFDENGEVILVTERDINSDSSQLAPIEMKHL